MINTNPAKLSRALTQAGFDNIEAIKRRYIRAMRKGVSEDVLPRPSWEKGYFRHYTDYSRRKDQPVRHKFEVRTTQLSFTDEAVVIATAVLPKATVHTFLNQLGITVTWRQVGQEIR